jgi:peptidoglycan hydrolase-like protein with peptidoglycan-binding domain
MHISDKAPTGSPVLKQGSTGSRVAQLQKCLNKVIASRLGVDSEYGPKTQAAVKSFQKKAGGLEVDGEYGPRTASKLEVFRNRLK